MVAETERLDLDGVDVDLEGNGELDDAKDAFVAFDARPFPTSCTSLHKQLTVDSFAYQWNAPLKSDVVERRLFPWVRWGINSMGYEEVGANGKEWRAYAAQRAAAGPNAGKLLLGVPGHKADWQGNSAAEQLDWIVRDDSVGMAIWDAQFSAPYWHTAAPWKALEKMKRRDK